MTGGIRSSRKGRISLAGEWLELLEPSERDRVAMHNAVLLYNGSANKTSLRPTVAAVGVEVKPAARPHRHISASPDSHASPPPCV